MDDLIDTLIDVGNLPLSIVVVGVGPADFRLMVRNIYEKFKILKCLLVFIFLKKNTIQSAKPERKLTTYEVSWPRFCCALNVKSILYNKFLNFNPSQFHFNLTFDYMSSHYHAPFVFRMKYFLEIDDS